MGFKSDTELASIGCGPEDMCLAQLHYTVLGHLSVAFNYRRISQPEAPDFTHAVIRLSSALDVADEILGRIDSQGSTTHGTRTGGRTPVGIGEKIMECFETFATTGVVSSTVGCGWGFRMARLAC